MSVTVEIPKEVYEVLEDEARRRGCGVLDIIISTVIEKLDPMVRVEIYLRLHEKYLKEAEELYVKGNLLQASLKGKVILNIRGCFQVLRLFTLTSIITSSRRRLSMFIGRTL